MTNYGYCLAHLSRMTKVNKTNIVYNSDLTDAEHKELIKVTAYSPEEIAKLFPTRKG